jgi:hypothetical protein
MASGVNIYEGFFMTEEAAKSRLKFKFKDLMYGFLVIFILLLVYELGQIASMQTIATIQGICPKITVLSADPFVGVYYKINTSIAIAGG